MKNRNIFIPNMPTRFDVATQTRIPAIDLNPASKLGNLMLMAPNETIEEIEEAASLIEKQDAILCVGDVVLTAAAIAYACKKNGSANLLRWDRNLHSYYEQEVSI